MSESKRGSLGSSGKGARQPGSRGAPATPRKSATVARQVADEVAGGSRDKPATAKIVPIYTRLPRGPHPLGSTSVARNQRIRIHGGMIEAATTRGYPLTSVKLVIGLAGVSRRSFYEQFSGKEDCFMATFDLVVNRAVKRLTEAYHSAEGGRPERLRAALQAWCGEAEQSPKALRLAIAEAQSAGPEGLRRLQRATAVCEGLLANMFANRCPADPEDAPADSHDAGADPRDAPADPEDSPADLEGAPADLQDAGADDAVAGARVAAADPGDEDPGVPPAPVVRAIVGGLRRATQMRLLDDDTQHLQPLVEEMAEWALLFKSPAVRRLRPRPWAGQPFPQTLELESTACGGEDRRARVLRSAIETGLRQRKFSDVNAPRIAEGAGLPVEAVTRLYADPRACYVEALEVLGDELLQMVAAHELLGDQWADAVCGAVDAVLAHLADSPARLMTLTMKAFEAGPAAIAAVGTLAYELATLLTEGAPERPRTRIAVEAIGGGVWHILYCEVLAGRGHRLPVLSEYVAYVVLAPYLGAERAVAAIVGSRMPQRAGYRRLDERRSAKWVNTTPTSTDATITTIKGA
ncbi:MAG TPA: TetR/AcrR family transcriptional regulator [Solirubrobacteraceae bacterium]|jgi:AcrR family transcriptional regulator|nr:TetR/AcrR family transcriptional regulator [Solirubrobacteraceae bacterium]